MSDFDWIQDGINSIVRQSGNDMHADKMQAQYDALQAQLDAETKLHLEHEAQNMALVIGLKDRIEALQRSRQLAANEYESQIKALRAELAEAKELAAHLNADLLRAEESLASLQARNDQQSVLIQSAVDENERLRLR